MAISSVLLLTAIAALMLTSAVGQQQRYDLLVERMNPSDPNRLLLRCSNVLNGELVREAQFFRSGRLFDIPNGLFIPDLGVRFVVDRSSEGNFTCGDAVSRSTPAQTIVARPEASEIPPMETFYADVGSTARLDCPIAPGYQLPLYYVTWRNASDPSVIFYQINPIRSNGQEPLFELSSRYTLDFLNFSLFISNVELSDAAHDYQCVLGVVDPSASSQEFPYTSTQTVNISLNLFEAPQFITEPTSEVVLRGTNVTFTCAVFSSPGESTINWRLGNRILDRHNDRYSITPDVVSMDGGVKTVSTLIIESVTGFDSNTIECFSEYFVSAAVMVSTIRSEAVLSVLDEIEIRPPISFQSGGFIFRMIPKHPLLIPVMIRLIYIDADNPTARANLSSITTFFNTTPMNVIAFSEDVPSFDSFYLEAMLFYRDQNGPVVRSSDAISRPGPEPFMIAFWVTLAILVPLLILIIIFIIVQICLNQCRKNNALNPVINILNETRNEALKNTIVCCGAKNEVHFSDGSKSRNGFTDKLADKFVAAIVQAIQFGERDDKIKPKLDDAGVKCVSHAQSNGLAIGPAENLEEAQGRNSSATSNV